MKSRLGWLLCALLAAPALAVDDPAGLERLRAAAEAGQADAQLELGILYEYGFNKPDNLVPALSWYLRAAENGVPDAGRRRDALMGKLKPAEVEEAKRLAQTKTSAAPAPPAEPAATPASAPTETPPAATP